MIEVQLTELDLSLEVADIDNLEAVLDEHSTVGLQGPLTFGVDAQVNEYGYLDLDLIGFPYIISAYDIAVKNGFVGSEQQWLESLKGEDGELGQAGLDAVQNAQSYAESASGSATAAAGFRTEAYTYSGVAGVHARSANEAFTNAVAARDETGEIAQAMTSVFQQSEAILTDISQLATATLQERVSAETARSEAQLFRDRSAISETSARESSASASDSATLAVNARNQAGEFAEASLLSASYASSYADDARTEAEAARQSTVIATAARDEAKIAAEGVSIYIEQAQAYADEAEAWATASQQSALSAQASFEDAEDAAEASLQYSRNASASATQAAQSATASDQSRVTATTKAGEASVSAQNAASSATDANGSRVAAESARQTAATYRNEAGQSAQAAATYRDQAEVLADQAGQIYSVVAGRVTQVEGRLEDAEGRITVTESVAITARDKVNTIYSVQLNSNGFITGWRAANDGTTGSFSILGNAFYLVDPNGGIPFMPFTVVGNQATFNANVRINGNLFINGTINLPALVNNVVSSTVAAYNGAEVTLSNNTPKRVHGLYIDVERATSPIDIDFNFWATFTHNAGGSFIAYVQLVRSRGDSGGDVLLTVPIYGSGMANDVWQGAVPIKYLDKPLDTGQWHYYVQVYFNVNNMTTQAVSCRYGKLTELKNNPTSSISTGTGSGTGVGSGGGTGGGGGGYTPPIGGGGGNTGGGGSDTGIGV